MLSSFSLNIEILESIDDISLYDSLIDNWEYSIFDYYSFVFGKKQLNDFLKNSLENDQKDSSLIVLKKGGVVLGCVQLCFMDWESKFFSYKIGKLLNLCFSPSLRTDELDVFFKEVKAIAKSRDYDMIYLKVNTKDRITISTMFKQSFLLTDTSLDYAVDTKKYQPCIVNKQLEIIEGDLSHLDICKEMMEVSFSNHFGRYNFDDRLLEKGTEVYGSWIEASLNGYADLVLLGMENDKLAGITVWKHSSEVEKRSLTNIGHYSIGAIHPDYAGRKIFNDLTSAGMAEMNKRGVRFIEGPTNVGNHPVQSSYSSMGWKILSSKYCYHLWL